MVRTDIGVVGNDNGVMIAFVLHLRSPQINLAKLFEIEAVKQWLDALSEARSDLPDPERILARRRELRLRHQVEDVLKSGPGCLRGPRVLDLGQLGKSGPVKPLANAAGRMSGPAIFRDGVGIVGDGKKIDAKLHYHCAKNDIDAAELLAHQPALVHALITAIVNRDKNYRTANLADDINRALTESSAVRQMPDRFPIAIVDEPGGALKISDRSVAVVGNRNPITVKPTAARVDPATMPDLRLPQARPSRPRWRGPWASDIAQDEDIDLPSISRPPQERDERTVEVNNEPDEQIVISHRTTSPAESQGDVDWAHYNPRDRNVNAGKFTEGGMRDAVREAQRLRDLHEPSQSERTRPGRDEGPASRPGPFNR
ncbi:hypothetical protein ACQPYH_28205 [Kribbella sp. CA-245084]|uniref:hypothetical protein n=1 Tax=Kribbella sp. CA-245084 TaxID=3239940 RepID=UPI003D94A4A8